jgi:hypothetical protein
MSTWRCGWICLRSCFFAVVFLADGLSWFCWQGIPGVLSPLVSSRAVPLTVMRNAADQHGIGR